MVKVLQKCPKIIDQAHFRTFVKQNQNHDLLKPVPFQITGRLKWKHVIQIFLSDIRLAFSACLSSSFLCMLSQDQTSSSTTYLAILVSLDLLSSILLHSYFLTFLRCPQLECLLSYLSKMTS